MFSPSRRTTHRPWRAVAALLFVTVFLRLDSGWLAAQEADRPAVAPGVLTSFEQIWQLTEAEQREWHRVRLNYVVYYYDPLWMALWGRCGEADSYLSFGTKVFPIKAGQRILVE